MEWISKIGYKSKLPSVIKGKLRCSINDWAINAKLLAIPYSELHEENYELKNLVLDRILGEEIENQLDSRL